MKLKPKLDENRWNREAGLYAKLQPSLCKPSPMQKLVGSNDVFYGYTEEDVKGAIDCIIDKLTFLMGRPMKEEFERMNSQKLMILKEMFKKRKGKAIWDFPADSEDFGQLERTINGLLVPHKRNIWERIFG